MIQNTQSPERTTCNCWEKLPREQHRVEPVEKYQPNSDWGRLERLPSEQARFRLPGSLVQIKPPLQPKFLPFQQLPQTLEPPEFGSQG